MIYGLIYICPECRRVAIFRPHDDGTLIMNKITCASDGYEMRMIKLDTFMVDQILKGGIPRAN